MKTLAFKSSGELRDWLDANHDKSDGVWLRLFKKSSAKTAVTRTEALDQLLCYGWIDGQARPHDEHSWLQKITPRLAKSGWSRVNTGHVERLVKAGQMQPAGLKAVEGAKADGRWHAAYDPPSKAAPPEDFLRALAECEKAKAFFETLNKANVYAIVYRLQTAKKPETREKRLKNILVMLDRGESFHP